MYKIEKEGWNIYAFSMHSSERLNSELKEELLVYENTLKFSTILRNFGESGSQKVNQNQWPVYGFTDKKWMYIFKCAQSLYGILEQHFYFLFETALVSSY